MYTYPRSSVAALLVPTTVSHDVTPFRVAQFCSVFLLMFGINHATSTGWNGLRRSHIRTPPENHAIALNRLWKGRYKSSLMLCEPNRASLAQKSNSFFP